MSGYANYADTALRELAAETIMHIREACDGRATLMCAVVDIASATIHAKADEGRLEWQEGRIGQRLAQKQGAQK